MIVPFCHLLAVTVPTVVVYVLSLHVCVDSSLTNRIYNKKFRQSAAMSVLADYLAEVRKPQEDESPQKEANHTESTLPDVSLVQEQRSPLRPSRFTPGPDLDASGTRRPKPILKSSQDASLMLGAATGASPGYERSPNRTSKKLTFAMDLARPFADFGNPKPQRDAITSSLSPSAQRAVDKYRSNVTRVLGSESPLVDRNHYHHLAPLVRVARRADAAEREPILKRPVDPLKEGQVAILDSKVQEHMRQCEHILGLGGNRTSDAVGDKLASQVNEQRWQQHVRQGVRTQEYRAKEEDLRLSPARRRQLQAQQLASKVPRFTVTSRTSQQITGAALSRARREKAEANASLERLARDTDVQRQHRLIQAVAEVERKGALYKAMIEEQDAEEEVRQRGHVGNKLSPEELIAEWRAQIADRAETEEMEEERERARSYRRAMRVEREEKRKALDLLSGLTAVQLEDRRRRSELTKAAPSKRRWRITRMGSVDTFHVPRWSSCPFKTLNGDVSVVELDSCVVNHVTWIQTSEGWIPVQVAFNGFSRTQLFAEAPEDEGDGVVSAMLDSLDAAHENIVDAMTMCPPEQLKSQAEVKDMLKQMEFTRQSLRDLPDGRRDMIRRIWDSMQSSSKQRSLFHDDGREDH